MLVLIGESGAGPHDLTLMMRRGRAYWSAAESQWYAEPKRLAKLGYLSAEKRPGQTRDRTHYVLTDKGRDALREWVATPAPLARVQDEPIARSLAADLTDPQTVAQGLDALHEQLADWEARLDQAEGIAKTLPHRERVLMINHRHARRQLESQRQWLAEMEAELRRRDEAP